MSVLSLRNLLRLNLRGNKVTEVNTARLPLLEILNCSETSLRTLSLPEGPLKSLIAHNNSKKVIWHYRKLLYHSHVAVFLFFLIFF